MTRILHLCHAFLVGVFALPTSDLGAPEFAKRQAATVTLKRWQPASWPALIHAAATTDCPEVRQRCETILANALLPRTEAEWDGVFERIVADRWERNGIPWTRAWVKPWLTSSPRAQEQFVRWAGAGLGTSWNDWHSMHGRCADAADQRLTVALNDRRFAELNLPRTCDPTPWYVVRMGWQMRKAAP